MTTQQTEAMQLSDWLNQGGWPSYVPQEAAAELRRQHARIVELEERLEIDYRHPYDGIAARDVTIKALDERIAALESQLEAIGAGGVEPLRKQAAAQQAVQPVAWLAEYVDREGNSKWYVSTHKDLATENDMHGTPKPLYTNPTKQGMDAQELLAALGDLSFACFGGIGTKAPDAATYNRTFAVLQKHRDAAQAKQGG